MPVLLAGAWRQIVGKVERHPGGLFGESVRWFGDFHVLADTLRICGTRLLANAVGL
jgi:hypothetical protein